MPGHLIKALKAMSILLGSPATGRAIADARRTQKASLARSPSMQEDSTRTGDEDPIWFQSPSGTAISEAIYHSLTEVERMVFQRVRADGISGSAVGKQLGPPLSGQQVGQILSQAMIKIHECIRNRAPGGQ